ncbi:MAG: choice-of-anchor J domain-containing protein [Candidatus Cloacimonetes bacterium]|nr:choice-of-anchor J domain-containing protein [Candidatus Cloacimonadota bacterium]
MKKNWLIILALMLLSSAFAYEVVAYQEDFESGAEGWIMYDGAESPNNWHPYDNGDAQGDVWWMGDTELAVGDDIGGYYNHQYLVLDTPARTITTDGAVLTFKMRLGLEDPGVSGDYDGWDSANIRISTDGGTTWNVISGSPAYHFQNSYAFGSEHGEGLGVPGWGGIVDRWTNASFDLSAYIGQSVKIRFAFASDPAYSTADQSDMFGFMVDDISFGGYTNNGVDDDMMTWSSLVPLGGQLWHIATDVTAPSPTHVMKNQNEAGSYNPNMLNYLVSPSITLPSEGEIRADFMLMGEFIDNGTFPDVDYFGWEISPDDGISWYAMSNPYNDEEGVNYVYSDAPTTWMSMVDSYSLSGYITDYAGQTVKFRWYFESNDTAEGTGLMIDDFKIYNDIYIAPPENLVAEVDGNSVYLDWDAPGTNVQPGEEGWLTYCGENEGNSIGANEAADFSVAAKWDAMGIENSIQPYVGMNITKIAIFPMEAACEYSVRIWNSNAFNLVFDQAVTDPVIGEWNEIVLDTPYTIPAATVVSAGYRCNAELGHPAGIDEGPTVNGYGNMINMGSWATLTSLADLEGNWNIKVYVADAQGREYVMGELPETPSYANAPLQKHFNRNYSRINRDVASYRIYRDDTLVTEVDGTITEYTDTEVAGGTHNYHVTAMYGEYESPATNTAVVFVMPESFVELSHDDGSPELGLNVGSPRQMGVLYNEYAGMPVTLKYGKVFVETVNTAQLVLRIHEVDPETGLPGTMIGNQVQYPAANILPGWNYIPIPGDRVVESGQFYMVLLETPNHSAIGVDTSSNGFSYTNLGSGWNAYADGEIMIRSVVETSSGGDDLWAPSNLHTTSIVGMDVHLAWDAPIPPPTGEWITWCDVTNTSNGIGTNAAAQFDIAHRYDANDLANLHGSTLTTVKFVPKVAQATYTIKIWTGTSATQPTTLVHSQLVASPVANSWNEVELDTIIPIPATGNLWIGVGIDTPSGFPAGCDAGPVNEGKGNLMNFGGWTTLTQVTDPSLPYNWSIQGYVDYGRALAHMPAGIVEAPLGRPAGNLSVISDTQTATNSNQQIINRNQTGYRIFRDGALVSFVNNPETLSFVDSVPSPGSYSYYVTATYTGGESEPSNTIDVEIEELEAPTDLTATVNRNEVVLNWVSPATPMEGEWISWSDNSMLGNSIGLDGPANFDVAHRYEANDLTDYVGGAIAQVKFAPMYLDAIYTIKIWTGGTATTPGSLVHSQVVSSFNIDDWTTVYLSNPIPIDAGVQYWIGYNVNTQGGFPAGCDDGPAVEGKGNLINMGGWSTLSQITDPPLGYNWLIQTFVAQNMTLKAIPLPTIAETPLPTPSGNLASHRISSPKNNERATLIGFKVYRDGTPIATIGDPLVTTYTDLALPNGDYVYGVTGLYGEAESMPVTVDVTVNVELGAIVLEDSFEEYDDFATVFAPWTLLDLDTSTTYGFDGIEFPNSESAMAYIIFNPSATVPPITTLAPFEGDKMAASFAATTPPNTDWLITPQIALEENSSIRFYARSHTTQYGMERFRVGVLTYDTIIHQLFQFVTGPDYVEAPADWTEYSYDLSQYDDQSVYIGIQCISDDAFVFYVDNFTVYSGSSDNNDVNAPVVKTELKGNYPNPFNPETTIRYSVKDNGPVSLEIYNLKGQLVKRLVNTEKAAGEHTVIWNGTDMNNRNVSSGVYFYKMTSGKYSASKKMIMMK